jgi:Tol biopolymer transport system component
LIRTLVGAGRQVGVDGEVAVVVRLSKYLPRACAVLAVFLCAALCCSCAGLRHAGHGAQSAEPTSGNPLGHSGCGPPITYEVFQQDAFGVDWSKANDLIAFNTKGNDGLYHIYTVKPDGSNRQQFGVGSPNFPQRTTGTPVRSPSGRFIAFVAEKSTHPGNSVGAAPGWGSYSDLWVATAGGSRAWQFTDVPADRDHGTIIPEFSPDGRLLEWTERTATGKVLNPDRFAGYWVIKVADFNVAPDGTPSLSGIRTVSPPGDAFNESGGFSADSSSLVFSSDFETHNFWKNQIYRLDLNSGATTRLTKGDGYNEHPRHTPAGQVLWMTSSDNPSRGTDWWTMNADGSNPQRLSSFNTDAQMSGARGFGTKQVYATVVQTAEWSPDNRYFYGDAETNLLIPTA